MKGNLRIHLKEEIKMTGIFFCQDERAHYLEEIMDLI